MNKHILKTIITLALLVISVPSFAISSGDACSTTGHTAIDNTGNTYSTFICDGGNWVILTQGTTNGYLGINKASPSMALDIAGELKVGSSSAPCNSSNEGLIKFNSSTKNLEVCNGTTWDVIE